MGFYCSICEEKSWKSGCGVVNFDDASSQLAGKFLVVNSNCYIYYNFPNEVLDVKLRLAPCSRIFFCVFLSGKLVGTQKRSIFLLPVYCTAWFLWHFAILTIIVYCMFLVSNNNGVAVPYISMDFLAGDNQLDMFSICSNTEFLNCKFWVNWSR